MKSPHPATTPTRVPRDTCDDPLVSRRLTRAARAVRPVRVRLTIAFASVIALVLLVTGVLIYVQFARDFDARVDAELIERQRAIAGLARGGRAADRVVALAGEDLAQIYDRRGALAASSRQLRGTRLLSNEDVGHARRRTIFVTVSRVAGTDDGARARAFAVASGRVAVIAESRDDRERGLNRLALLLALALPGALILASLAGYQVARGALAPVERMRTRAASIGHGDLSERLPEPGTLDELDRLAETLNDLLGRLASSLERERQIVGDASHELRTPISVLRTRIDVALRGEQDPAKLRAALEGARDDAGRLARLADDILVLARADQGQLPLRRDPLDVQDVLEQLQRRHRAAASGDDRRLVIANDIDGGAVVLADADRLAQMLDNLIVNALRYGEGDIEIRAAVHDAATVEISVRDHGPGFPVEFLPRAFDRFSQAGSSQGGEGSGLGLAIVEVIARAQGGTARASNHPDGGAVTTFTVPLA